MYSQNIIPKVNGLNTPWKRVQNPTDAQRLYGTSAGFDIFSDTDTNRLEFWESPTGTLTKSEVDLILFGSGGGITKDTIIDTTTDETIRFDSVKADKFIITINNKGSIARSVQVLSTLTDSRIEAIRIDPTKIYSLEIPKPYSNFKLVVPANFQLKFFPYNLI